jgi:lipoate-protein ligase A
MTRVARLRVLTDPPAPGPWNMAVDEALLIDAADNGTASLRFYQWNEPTLSLGYFQSVDDRQRHPPSLHAALVRRQTGGGAILHDHELTYSIVLPSPHPLARHAEGLYKQVHQAFIAELSPLFNDQVPGHLIALDNAIAKVSRGDEPFLCFERRARGDVLLERPRFTHKILGSAQRRLRGAILQHGSLLLQKSAAAPELEGIIDLTGASISSEELAKALPGRLATLLGCEASSAQFPADLRQIATEIAARKYAAPAWSNRR